MLGFLACATSGTPTPSQTPPTEAAPVQNQPIEGEPDCMKACLRNNMARAVAAEVIDTDCRKSCDKNETPMIEL